MTQVQVYGSCKNYGNSAHAFLGVSKETEFND
jgi:hypothetical protein